MKKSVTISREDLKNKNYKARTIKTSGNPPEKRKDVKVVASVLAKLV